MLNARKLPLKMEAPTQIVIAQLFVMLLICSDIIILLHFFKGVPYEYLIDRYTVGKTCIPRECFII